MNYMKKLSICILSVLASGTGIASEPVQRTNEVQMNEVVFVDHDLNRTYEKSFFGMKSTKQIVKVSVNSKGIRTTPGGTAEAWVVFRNHTDYPLQIQAQTMFFDSDMAPMQPDPMWKRVFLPANSLGTYKEQSYDGNISYYRIEVKEAK